MRRCGIVSALAIALIVPAAAQPFGELPVRAAPPGLPATCLRDVGDGLLTLLGPLRRSAFTTDLLRVTGRGTEAAGRLRLGRADDCLVVGAGGGTVAAAGLVRAGRERSRLAVTVREPGSMFVRPVTLATVSVETRVPVSVAVSGAGDVVVAWAEERQPRALRRPGSARILVARRSAGGAFSATQTVSPRRSTGTGNGVEVSAGVDDEGRATVVLVRGIPNRGRIQGLRRVEAVSAARGQPFAAPQVLRDAEQDTDRPALAIAPTGEGVAAVENVDGILPFELSAAGGRFTALPQYVAGRLQRTRTAPVVAVRPGGGAVLAWRYGGLGSYGGGVEAAARDGVGRFGPARVVARPSPSDGRGVLLAFGGDRKPEPPLDLDNDRLDAAVARDGRAVLTWTRPRRAGEAFAAAVSVAGTLGTGFGPPAVLGSPCRAVGGVASTLLSDGTPAAAFADNVTEPLFGSGPELPVRAGRLHIAVPGRPAADPDPPAIRLRAPRRLRLDYGQPLRVRAVCDGPCDLRGTVRGPPLKRPRTPLNGRRVRAGGGAAAARGGAVRLGLTPGSGLHVAPRAAVRVKVIAHACAPGGRRSSRDSATVRVTRRPLVRLERPRRVRARRKGREVIVTWNVTRPARRLQFFVEARRGRRSSPRLADVSRVVEGRGRRRFRVRLKPGPNSGSIRFVAVTAARLDQPGVLPAVIDRVEE